MKETFNLDLVNTKQRRAPVDTRVCVSWCPLRYVNTQTSRQHCVYWCVCVCVCVCSCDLNA